MRQSSLGDAELVRRVLAGDTKSFAALVGRYADALGSIAFLKVRNSEDARDIVQQAFFTAYANLSSLKEPGRFGAWVKGIVLNLARKTLDRRTRTERFLERLPRGGAAPDPARAFALREKVEAVLNALDALDEPRREIVALYYLDRMKVDAIAELLDRPSGTVKRILAEARGILRKELIEMAREEFKEYALTNEQRERLAKIAEFPQTEPKITVTPLEDKATKIRAVTPLGQWVALKPGAEACFADYDHPGRKLTSVSHQRTEGPVRVDGEPALRIDDLVFTEKGSPKWVWRQYYSVQHETCVFRAHQYGPPESCGPLIKPGHPDWEEAESEPESLVLDPGAAKGPNGAARGMIVDRGLFEVKIGKRSFRCVRRLGGGDKVGFAWSDGPITRCATEEFFLDDGRRLLWRRYNGLEYLRRNPNRKGNAAGVYEDLRDAGMASLEVFGETYYLWYDQIPDYALR